MYKVWIVVVSACMLSLGVGSRNPTAFIFHHENLHLFGVFCVQGILSALFIFPSNLQGTCPITWGKGGSGRLQFGPAFTGWVSIRSHLQLCPFEGALLPAWKGLNSVYPEGLAQHYFLLPNTPCELSFLNSHNFLSIANDACFLPRVTRF